MEPLLADDHSLLDLAGALLHHFVGLILSDVWKNQIALRVHLISCTVLTLMMISIQNTSAEHSTVAVRAVIHRQSVGQIIDERELRTIGLVVAGHQHVHLIGVAGSQVICQVLTSEVGSRLRAQLVAIAHFVEQDVLRNVLHKLHGVPVVANSSNQQRVGDFVDLVFI